MSDSIKSIIDALALVGNYWRDKDYPLRKCAIQHAASEFCLSEPSFTLAMDWIFAHWTKESIEKLIQENNPKKIINNRHPIKYAIQILAGTTPAMIAQGFLQGALLNRPQCLKLPKHQTLFASLLYQSFCEQIPEIADLFSLDNGQHLPLFYEKLKKTDLVIAYGHDETMAILKNYLSPDSTFVAHGHAESAAIIFKEAANLESLEQLAYDMLAYDQRGCLSPRAVFIEQGGALTPYECAQQFAEIILPRLSMQFPRGGLFSGEAEEIFHQRMLYQFRGKVFSGHDWTVCYDENLVWPQESLPRFLPFKPFNTINQLNRCYPHLLSIGYAGNTENAHLIQMPGTRICFLGEMQKQCLLF